MKDRMNRLKRREWYRPVAPTVALEHMLDLFEVAISSPYMSFAPILRPDAARTCPAVAHFDNTSRPQTVSATDEPWVHALLLALHFHLLFKSYIAVVKPSLSNNKSDSVLG